MATVFPFVMNGEALIRSVRGGRLNTVSNVRPGTGPARIFPQKTPSLKVGLGYRNLNYEEPAVIELEGSMYGIMGSQGKSSAGLWNARIDSRGDMPLLPCSIKWRERL